MLPLAQLYARDVPGLPAPAGTDLLQVLWCPFDHPPEEYMPRTVLFWRSAREVTDVLTTPPEPKDVQNDGYLPEPCTVSPERITEYPSALELDKDLREQVELRCIRHALGSEPSIEDYRAGRYAAEAELYGTELSTAPGWKVGGWIAWGLTDPYPQPCPACGAPTEPLLTIAGAEWDASNHGWIPIEDREAGALDVGYPDGPGHPTQILIARGYDEIIRVCSAFPDHPHVQLMQ
jgi:hypothetical protein